MAATGQPRHPHPAVHRATDRDQQRAGGRGAGLRRCRRRNLAPAAGPALHRPQRAFRLRLPEERVQAHRRRLPGAGAVHGQAVAQPVSGTQAAQSGFADRAAPSGSRRPPPGARRCATDPPVLAKIRVDRSSDEIEAALKAQNARPSLPPHLDAGIVDDLPDTPGVYLFYADNDLPLYVGKARDIRQRVLSHFSADHGSARK